MSKKKSQVKQAGSKAENTGSAAKTAKPAKSQKVARKERIEAMRAEQRRKERTRTIMFWSIAGLVIAVLAGVAGVYVWREAGPMQGLETFDYKGGSHKGTAAQYVEIDYPEKPPAGGEHNNQWQNCGVYDKPIKSAHAVHSLEHGAVWITYQPDLPKAEVDKLRGQVEGEEYLLLSPYPGLPSRVVASSWNNQVKLGGADDERLNRFIREFRQGPQTPEKGAACTGGVSETVE